LSESAAAIASHREKGSCARAGIRLIGREGHSEIDFRFAFEFKLVERRISPFRAARKVGISEAARAETSALDALRSKRTRELTR